MMEERVLIPEKLYVGVNRSASSALPHAAVTAWGTDNSAKGRMATVDAWAKNAIPIENTVQQGFAILGSSGRDEWLIGDPRGFSVSVKADHMFKTLKHSTVLNNHIVDACVWGRSGGHNILLNTQTELYEKSLVVTRIANSKAPWKDVKIGNRVTLVNGLQGVYLGKYHRLGVDVSTYDLTTTPTNRLNTDANKYFLILKDEKVRHYRKGVTQELNWMSAPKLAVIDSHDEIAVSDAEAQVNQLLADPTCVTVFNSWSNTPFLAVNEMICMDNVTLSLEPHDAITFEDAIASQTKTWVKLITGEWGEHNHNYTRNANTYSLAVYDESAISQHMLAYVTEPNRHNGRQHRTKQFTSSDVAHYSQLRVSYTSALGNNISRLL